MKTKPNISGDSIKQFFFNNGEKIVLCVTVVVLLLFMYSAFSSKPLDESKSPDAIQQASRQVTERIGQETWRKHQTDIEAQQPHTTSYTALIATEEQPVPEVAYKFAREISPLLFPSLIKRAEPQIFPVEELQISSGRAIVPYAAAGSTGVGTTMLGPTVAPLIMTDHAPMVIGPGGIVGAGTGNRTQLGPGMQGVQAVGAEPKAKFYAVITGAVPYSKEVSEYGKRFDYAMPAQLASADATPTRPGMAMMMSSPQSGLSGQVDQPEWYYFQVERAEVQDENDPNRNWVRLYRDAVKDLFDNWAIKPPQTPEIVNSDYLLPAEPYPNDKYPYLFPTWPLPPLYLKNWGLEASHPKVKLISTEATTENQPTQEQQDFNLGQPAADGAAGAGPAADAPAASTPPAATPPAATPPTTKPRTVAPPVIARPTLQPPRGKYDAYNGVAPTIVGPRPGMVGSRDHDGGFGIGPRGGMSNWQGQMVNPMMAAANAQAASVTNKLFRFVDLTAEPGKTYRYRVQLVLRNPNYNLQNQCLADPKFAKSQTLSSPWVEVGPVTIPREFQLLADSVVRSQEPRAKMSVLALVKTKPPENSALAADADYWLEVKKDFDLPLGAIPDLRNESFDKVSDPSAQIVRDIDKVTIDTHDTMLVDLRNDDPLGNYKSKGPTEVLTVDNMGRLTLASSAADVQVAKDFKDRTTSSNDAATPAGAETPTPIVRPPSRGRGAAPGIGSPIGPRGGPGPAGAKARARDTD